MNSLPYGQERICRGNYRRGFVLSSLRTQIQVKNGQRVFLQKPQKGSATIHSNLHRLYTV